MDFVFFILIACIGAGVGLLSGMFGIGGGTIIVPLLHLGFGLPITAATATSLFTIVPTSISGFIKHARNHTAHFKFGLLLGLAGACVSPIGVYLNTISPPLLIVIIAGIIIISSAVRMLATGKNTQPLCAESDMLCFNMRTISAAALIGIIAGLLSGYAGVGGGFIMVPLMVFFMRFPLKYAAGTSLIAIAILAIPGTIASAIFGNIEYMYGIALMVGSIPGAQVGAWLVTRFDERIMRRAFGCFLICVGMLLVVNGVLLGE
jgi:uncharacterized protein